MRKKEEDKAQLTDWLSVFQQEFRIRTRVPLDVGGTGSGFWIQENKKDTHKKSKNLKLAFWAFVLITKSF